MKKIFLSIIFPAFLANIAEAADYTKFKNCEVYQKVAKVDEAVAKNQTASDAIKQSEDATRAYTNTCENYMSHGGNGDAIISELISTGQNAATKGSNAKTKIYESHQASNFAATNLKYLGDDNCVRDFVNNHGSLQDRAMANEKKAQALEQKCKFNKGAK